HEAKLRDPFGIKFFLVAEDHRFEREDRFASGAFVVSTSLMKTKTDYSIRSIAMAAMLLFPVAVLAAPATMLPYQIYDIGVVDSGDEASQGFGVSHGDVAVGRSTRTSGSQAFTWTLKGGIVGLPNLGGRSNAVSNSANDTGIVVGTAANTLFGTDRLPVIWQNGAVSQLPLP